MALVTARLLLLGLIPFLILGSRRFVSGIAFVAAAAHRPLVRYTMLAFIGVATMVGSIVAYETSDEVVVDATASDHELLRGGLVTTPCDRANAITDRGTKLVLKVPVESSVKDVPELTSAEDRILHKVHLDEDVIRRGAADDRSNCHGWVFTAGRFILLNEDVQLILKENGYREQQDPRPGDLVVYRQNEIIAHTAIVRYVSEGQPVLVEGKWGELGVFLHAVHRSVYGTSYTFFRSERRGHVLAGITPPAPDRSR
jgi:hypothetical protein